MSFAVLLKGANVLRKARLRNYTIRRFNKGSWNRTLVHSSAKINGPTGKAITSLATLAATWVTYVCFRTLENDANLLDDQDTTVNVDNSVSPFPTKLGPPEYPVSAKYVLLGYGARSVTFVSFRVYALGVYIAEQDRHLIPNVLNSKFLSTAFIDTDPSKSHQENVKEAMSDPKKSSILIDNLLDSGARMLVKITPVRNTDFNHLRDGFVKSVLNHPEAKNNQEVLSAGLEELRKAFTLKGKVAKNDDLIVELQANGGLQLSYYDRKRGHVTLLGRVNQQLVGKYLFSQYMSGPKPLSPSAKDSVASHIVALV
ncbi:hypothetical protein HG535_0H04110 [Zygotorulaspora mrakii]|uniref:Altered inheritance of mitochondria protein 18, mitochondrial n=1 Tax=Zygotorulaspora mrakii TaxID=42260 RepID=A0A7H9B9U7_ZYGMR|nr:uncharacterized protein HG535_0H04110 [Zygotorulaspora mrakii]QLG75084.1 hypothetical protein HG535_0H04110 [Zygotorulaspora mrakii]